MLKRWVIVCVLVGASAVARADRLRAPDGHVKVVPSASVSYAIRDGYAKIPTVKMRGPDGDVVDVDEDLADASERLGYWRMTEPEVADEQVFAATAREISRKVDADEADKRSQAAAAVYEEEARRAKEARDSKERDEAIGWGVAIVGGLALLAWVFVADARRRRGT